jgi:hypothetical protein
VEKTKGKDNEEKEKKNNRGDGGGEMGLIGLLHQVQVGN